MLYATTRDPAETYTAQWALTSDRAPDGGFYVPFRPPYFYRADLNALKKKSFLAMEADCLNLLFSAHITEFDLMFAGGRSPVRMEPLGRRTLAGERWRNTDWTFSGYAEQICRLLRVEKEKGTGPWARIGVSMALILAMVLTLQKEKPHADPVDIALGADDLGTAAACLYLKAWGLPIDRVVCGCRESKGLWQLLHDGLMHTDILEPDSPMVDGLENLLAAESSQAEVRRFLNCVQHGRTYVPGEALLRKLRQDLAAGVISSRRMENTVPKVYLSYHYILPPDGALAYAGLLDYRTVSGSGNYGLVLCDTWPGLQLSQLAYSLKIEEKQAEKLI